MKRILTLIACLILTACAAQHSLVLKETTVLDQTTGLVWAKNANMPGKPLEWRGDDNVYAFNRGEHPMIVVDRDGNFLRSWGEGLFNRAHGVSMGPDDTIYCTVHGLIQAQEYDKPEVNASTDAEFTIKK